MDKKFYQVTLIDKSYLVFGKKATKVIVNADLLWFYNDEDIVIGIVPVKEIRYVRLCNE